MATRLYRLGRFAFRHRRWVLLGWLAALLIAGGAGNALKGEYTDNFSIPGTESQQALDVLDERFPQAGLENAEANVVLRAPEGEQISDYSDAVAATLDEVRDNEHVVNVTDPFATEGVSPDGTMARATVTYEVGAGDIETAQREELFAAEEPGEEAGLQVEFSGSATQEFEEPGGLAEMIGIAAALVILYIFFRAVTATFMPIVTAIIGVGIGLSIVTAASGFVDLSSETTILASMLGLAVGIDYALFITSRYRHEYITRGDAEDAAGRAVATAGSAVIFAGSTVVIALIGLLLVNIPMIAWMGLAAALTVSIAVLVALTLLPALLGFAGRRMLGRKGRAALDAEGDVDAHGKMPIGHRWAAFVTRRRWPVLLVTVIALGVVAVPAASLETNFPDEGTLSEDSTQRRAYDLIAQGWGPGVNGPLVMTVEGDGALSEETLGTIAQRLQTVEGVVFAAPQAVNESGDTALLTVIPATGPADPATQETVDRLRSAAGGIEAETGTRLMVTGSTALVLDVTDRLRDVLPLYLLIVVGLAMLLLILVFRSIAVPVKAGLGFLLTVLAAFGAVVAIFQWGWLVDLFGIDQVGPIVAFLPIILIGVIFGLAMDYEVFLVTRMREEYVHGATPNDAIVNGFRHSGRVVTAAALIMISVFASFLLEDLAIVKSMGFAFAFAIAVDAFLVRMTIVPAVLAALGHKAWWLPRWLDRALPKVDVEGEGLRVPAQGQVVETAPARR